MPQKKQHICPHDRYLKSILEDPKIAADFLGHNLPDYVLRSINLSTIKAQKESFIDEKLKMQITDILFSVDFAGKPGYIYLLLEHTSTVDRMLPFRMLKYSIAVMEYHLKKNKNKKDAVLPIVYPLMFYTGARPFKHSMNIYDLFGEHKRLAKEIYGRPYRLIDLTQISDEQMQAYQWFTLAGLSMKYVREIDRLLKNGSVIECITELKGEGELQYILQTFNYLTHASNIEAPDCLLETFEKALSEEGETVMTLAEHLRRQGVQQGIEQGIELEKKQTQERSKKTALILLEMGLQAEQISTAIGLSVSEVINLRDREFN